MTKIAIVTGGTRGIGASISKKLKSSNFKVIANYTSNDDAAESFSKENNIDISGIGNNFGSHSFYNSIYVENKSLHTIDQDFLKILRNKFSLTFLD